MISNSAGNYRSQNPTLVYCSRLPPPPLQSGTRPANRARFVGRSRSLRPAKMCSSFRSGSDRHNRYTFSAVRSVAAGHPGVVVTTSNLKKKRINRNEMDARDPASLLAMTERRADGPNVIVATVYTMYVLRWCEPTRYRYSTFPLAVASPWLPRRLNPIPNSNPKLIGLSLAN